MEGFSHQGWRARRGDGSRYIICIGVYAGGAKTFVREKNVHTKTAARALE